MILGIDPGKNGASCLMTDKYGIIRVKSFTGLSPEEIVATINRDWQFANMAFIEDVHASPQMGVTSAFSFGKNFGVILGALYSNPYRVKKVRPTTWQGALGCMSGGNKTIPFDYAKRHFPNEYNNKVFNKSSCEAVLLAYYGCRVTYQSTT